MSHQVTVMFQLVQYMWVGHGNCRIFSSFEVDMLQVPIESEKMVSGMSLFCLYVPVYPYTIWIVKKLSLVFAVWLSLYDCQHNIFKIKNQYHCTNICLLFYICYTFWSSWIIRQFSWYVSRYWIVSWYGSLLVIMLILISLAISTFHCITKFIILIICIKKLKHFFQICQC